MDLLRQIGHMQARLLRETEKSHSTFGGFDKLAIYWYWRGVVAGVKYRCYTIERPAGAFLKLCSSEFKRLITLMSQRKQR